MAWPKSLKNSVQNQLKSQLSNFQCLLPGACCFLLAAYCLLLR
jgi:hypothetical protein